MMKPFVGGGRPPAVRGRLAAAIRTSSAACSIRRAAPDAESNGGVT
jgi:hypothetical protein